ncbi:hypothetical protein [Pseudomonas sp.]|uniref:hypothetical protein n=1 Tax=Pseudomonas sp. TaxID=306 RepID=UPI00333F358B
MIERWLAKLGMVGVLAILLTVSIFVNLYQLRSAGKADARCATRIAEMVADVDRKTAAREVAALEIGRDTKADAEAAVQTITVETTRYVDRIRRETVEVPANCPRALPDGVRDALADAARAADSRVRAR